MVSRRLAANAAILGHMLRCSSLLLAISLCALGCSGGDEEAAGDRLIENFSPPGGGLVWTCPDGTVLSLASEVSKQSTLCLGIDGSECRTSGTPGPGDAECDDPAFNAFKGTCVEEYFSCFQPSGTCEILENGNQEWTDGALQNRNYMGFLTSYFAAGAQEPCVTGTLGNTTVSYSR